MKLVRQVLEHNRRWVAQRGTALSKHPARQIAIFTCMDTRLVDFLEPALGIGRGDAKIIKNAGATLVDPGGSVVRSLVVAIYALGCKEVFVVGHRDCGMSQIRESRLHGVMRRRGVPESAISALRPSLRQWVGAFRNHNRNVRQVVDLLRANPLIARSVPIHGLMFDPASGRLDLVRDGYRARRKR